MSPRKRGVLLAVCLAVVGFGCSVDELVGAGAVDDGDGGFLPDGGWRRDGGLDDDDGGPDPDDDGGDELVVLGPTFQVASDAGTLLCRDGCPCPGSGASAPACQAR